MAVANEKCAVTNQNGAVTNQNGRLRKRSDRWTFALADERAFAAIDVKK
jgi:hypothetical protein